MPHEPSLIPVALAAKCVLPAGWWHSVPCRCRSACRGWGAARLASPWRGLAGRFPGGLIIHEVRRCLFDRTYGWVRNQIRAEVAVERR